MPYSTPSDDSTNERSATASGTNTAPEEGSQLRGDTSDACAAPLLLLLLLLLLLVPILLLLLPPLMLLMRHCTPYRLLCSLPFRTTFSNGGVPSTQRTDTSPNRALLTALLPVSAR